MTQVVETPNNTPAFDGSKVMENIREKIKEMFAGIITDEQWNELIQKEIASFFGVVDKTKTNVILAERHKNDGTWHGKDFFVKEVEGLSPFQIIVWDLLIKETYKQFNKKLNDDYIGGYMDSNKELVQQNMGELIKQNSNEIMLNFFQMLFQNNIYPITDRLNQIQNKLRM